MADKVVDVAIIGSGSAGLAAYKSSLKYTDKVAIIEGGEYGTTCARVGCMPSKLLISAAEAAHNIEMSAPFGITVDGKISINGKKVMDRVKSERDRFVGFVLDTVNSIKEEYKIRGYAKFIDNNRLLVGENTVIKAKSIIIATGSSPYILPFLENLGNRLVVNDHIFDWDNLPESIAVFGPGVIGLELGQALHRLGVRVKIFGRGGTISLLNDPEVKDYANRTFSEELDIDTEFQLLDIKKLNDGIIIRYFDKQKNEKEEKYEFVLSATGRRPNLSKLCLDNTTLELDKHGVPLYNKNTMQCGNSSIFIAGDSGNYIPILHEASDEGTIAGINAAKYPEIVWGKRRAPLEIIFTDPQIGIVGRNFKSLEPASFATGKVSFEYQGRSRILLKNKGLLHVYAEYSTGRFLGAEIFGPRAEHLAHLLAWSYQQELTIEEMLGMPFYHPVIEEGLRTALRDANKKLIENGKLTNDLPL